MIINVHNLVLKIQSVNIKEKTENHSYYFDETLYKKKLKVSSK